MSGNDRNVSALTPASDRERLNSRQVEAFQAAMRLGSMTKAAEFLGVSQPAVSRLLTDLAQAVGFTLFRRHPGGAVPTDDARRFFEEVERLFVGLDDLSARAAAIRRAELGTVRVATMGPYGSGVLPEIVAGFLRDHGRISVSVEVVPQAQVADNVLSRRCDMGLTTLPVTDAGLSVTSLICRAAYCVLPAGHPLAERDRLAAADIAGEPFVSFPRAAPFRYRVDAVFEREGRERRIVAEGSNHETVCGLVAAGVGVSIVSPFSQHLRGNPALVFRPFDPALEVEIGLVAREGRMAIPAQRFADYTRSHFAGRARDGSRSESAA